MKKMKYIFINKKTIFIRNLVLVLFVISGGLSSCSDDVDGDSYFTFVGETAATFCENREGFSIFTKIIKESDNFTLLSTYGHYTCFVPTDSAFNVYFKANNIVYDNLSKADKREIANNHIIKGTTKAYLTSDLSTGAIPRPNMNERYLNISFTVENGRQAIYINKDAPIIEKDNEVHNGVVHVVSKVVEPSEEFLNSILKNNDPFSLFSEAFELTNLGDSIQGIYDDSYIPPYETGVDAKNNKYPVLRKYGFTLFAETNETFKSAGIENVEQLITYAKQYYGTDDLDDFTSRNNPLNKFISYHLLNRQMSTSTFLYNGVSTAPNAEGSKFEYYETMLKYRLIEIKSGNKINTLRNGSHIALDNALTNFDGANGYVHGLKNMMVYDENVMENDVLNKRIRFDVYAIPPQLTNNNIRWQTGSDAYKVPLDYFGEYLTFNDASDLTMFASYDWTNYQEDEMKITGWYDFTLRMHPVPPGTYEIRLGYRAETWRGVGQLFVDGEIAGIPVDLRIEGDDPLVGWVDDSKTTDNGIENDKMMRNRGYMKAPNSIITPQGNNSTLRQMHQCLRIIIGTYTFQEYAPHYFRVKNVEADNREFHFDYVEYVPISYLDSEGID